MMRFALNHICAPRLSLPDFLALAARLDVAEVELRSDLPDLVGTMDPAEVARQAGDAGVTILSVNALYPFNAAPAGVERLADWAARAGAQALVLCPLNEGLAVEHSATVAALDALKPVLDQRGLVGLVEPLGFPGSSLRHKAEALAAMTEADDGGTTYRLLHDTFHHHLAGEAEVYPNRTGLVHVSGVTDPTLAVEAMQDAHRVLVDGDDRLDNAGQIRALIAGGYTGPFSFEPFAAEVHAMDDIEAALRASMDHLRAAV